MIICLISQSLSIIVVILLKCFPEYDVCLFGYIVHDITRFLLSFTSPILASLVVEALLQQLIQMMITLLRMLLMMLQVVVMIKGYCGG